MLSRLGVQHEDLQVVRLSAFSESVVRSLVERGVSPDGIGDVRARLSKIGYVENFDQLIDKVFDQSKNPRYTTPFRKSRFTDGSKAVFYSALDDETSIAEIRFHLSKDQSFVNPTGSVSAPRYYWLCEADFSGRTMDLFQIWAGCPELTSQDESGYSKCKDIAEEARGRRIDAFRTPSARRKEGVCTPVFNREALSRSVRPKRQGKFVVRAGQIRFEDI